MSSEVMPLEDALWRAEVLDFLLQDFFDEFRF